MVTALRPRSPARSSSATVSSATASSATASSTQPARSEASGHAQRQGQGQGLGLGQGQESRRTEAAAKEAVADARLTVGEARALVAAFASESRDVALWPLVEVHKAIAGGAAHAEPGAHATLRNLIIRERTSQGEGALARRTLAALGAAGEDGVINVDDAQKILATARRDTNAAAADKAIGQAFAAFAAFAHGSAGPLASSATQIDAAANALFEAHFTARGLPYGANRASVQDEVLRCLRYLKGRDVSAPPDTRVLHEMNLGIDNQFQSHTAFVDPEQRRTWLRTGETWYGPISLDRGPEGKTLSITSLLHREARAWTSSVPSAVDRDDRDDRVLTRWIVGGPTPELYAYAALVENEDATHAIIERRHKGSGRIEYCELAF